VWGVRDIFPHEYLKDLDGILKNLWWVLEDLFFLKKTYGNTVALFISS